MTRASILAAWLDKLGALSPAGDPFRDPVGHTVREVLPVLLDAASGDRSLEDAAAPLERLMRIRAVQDMAPSEAVAFLFELKALLGETCGAEERIDRLALMAFDEYVRCREDAHAIQVRELRRRLRA